MPKISENDHKTHIQKIQKLRDNLALVIFGKPQAIDFLTLALFAGGSVLLEDIPGVGKTTLAKALARSINSSFQRIQFTPDLLPADILGSSVYNPVTGQFDFRRGPIFCNVLLADEINRASPRTQSALLEAMNEAQATIEGFSHQLPEPFLVLATQNPVEYHGTYPLPEAQLDRFMMQLDVGYPDPDVEIRILQSYSHNHPLEQLKAVLDVTDIQAIQRNVREVHCDQAICQYIVNLVNATRRDDRLQLGVSPRGAIMLSRAAQAAAYADGRDFVLPDDVQRLASYVLAHRLILTSKARFAGRTKVQIIKELIDKVKIPT